MEESHSQGKVQETSLFDYLLVLLKRKRFILGLTLGVTVLTLIITFIVPKTYRAESRILPMQSHSLSTQILAQLNGTTGLNLGAAVGIKTPNDLYVGLAKSRPVLDAVIDRFKLMALYRTTSREDARAALLGQLKIRDDRVTGIITVAVEDRQPKRAAEMANAFVEELRNMNKNLAVSEASQRRLFYEEQLKEVREALVKAEEAMKGFQEKTGAVRLDEQARAVIGSIAQVRAQIAAREVQLKVMKTYATPNNPDIQRLQEEIKGLNDQLGRLEVRGGKGPDPLLSTSRMPQLSTDYIRNIRELKFNEALYEILLKQFEAAKLDEARDATVIQVIERAIPPEKKIRPKRAQAAAIAFVVTLFLSTLLAFCQEFLEKSKQDPVAKERLERMKQLARFRG